MDSEPKELDLLSLKMKVLFLFITAVGAAINFNFVVEMFFIGKGAKPVIITLPHLLLGISFIGFGLGVLIT